MELIIPSPRAIQKKNFSVTIINFFPKRLSRNQSITLFMSIRGGMGLRRSSKQKAHVWNIYMTKHIMDFLYRFLSFNKQLFQPLNLY